MAEVCKLKVELNSGNSLLEQVFGVYPPLSKVCVLCCGKKFVSHTSSQHHLVPFHTQQKPGYRVIKRDCDL